MTIEKGTSDRNFIIGMVVALLLIGGAFRSTQAHADIVIKTPTTKPIYDISNDADVSKFTDGNVVCYIAGYTTTDQPTISCVKK